MIGWFLKSIGVGREIIARLDKAELVWARPTVLWVGLALLAPLVYFIIRRHRQSLPHVAPGMRNLLSACRAGVLLLLIIVLAGPALRLDEEVLQKPVLAFILDESASMGLPAGPFRDDKAWKVAVAAGYAKLPPAKAGAVESGKYQVTPELRKKLTTITRLQLAEAVLAHEKMTRIKPLTDRFEIKMYRAARQVRAGVLGEPAQDPLASAEGDETDLGGALDRAMDDAVGKPVAGVVLVSDGRWTCGADPLQVAQRLATAPAPPPARTPTATTAPATTPATGATTGSSATKEPGIGVPIWSVPVGSVLPVVDVGLVDVLAPPQVAMGDTVSIVATIESQGLDNRSVPVKLLTAAGKTLDSKPLSLNSAERQQVQLTFPANEPGAALLTVAVDEQPEEISRQNNRQRVLIKVDTERQRLLYLEGSPRWDFRFLDHSLRRDNGLETTLVMEAQVQGYGVAAADLPKAARLPQDAAGFAEYNAVLLGDISPALLPARLQEQLAKAVEEDGVGLVVQAGFAHMPSDFADGPLARLLPVKVDPAAAGGDVMLTGLQAPDFQPFRMKVTATGAIHPMFQLYDNATQNRAVWSRMPEFFWAAAVMDAGPTATVLAKLDASAGGEARPLVAERYAGRGRVIFIGTDSTYRWRRNIGNHLFYRFWGQAIRYVARNKEHRGDKSWMEASPGRVAPGESVAIELYAVDSQGRPLTGAQVEVQATGGDTAQGVTLSRVAQAGHYQGVWQPRNAGAYRLSFSDAAGRVATAAVSVEGAGREFRHPGVDRDFLGALADATGGGVLELDQLGKLPEVLRGEAIPVHLPHENEIWDNWLTLILLVGLYCIDVGVRRLLGLT